MTLTPPDFILAAPQAVGVPIILASCDSENIDELRELQVKGQSIYKLVRGYEKE
jgi:hypothetical protein